MRNPVTRNEIVASRELSSRAEIDSTPGYEGTPLGVSMITTEIWVVPPGRPEIN